MLCFAGGGVCGLVKRASAMPLTRRAKLSFGDKAFPSATWERAVTRLKDLTAVQRALRELQPRSVDLSSCSAVHAADGLGAGLDNAR